MKAAVFYGKNDLRIENISMPEPSDDEVLIKVRACGICGTDINIYNGGEGDAKTPSGTVLGHEFAGEIVKTGKNVKEKKPGDRVCVDPNIICGNCTYCHNGMPHYCESSVAIGTTVNGGFEEYVAVPATQAYLIPDSVSFAEAAMTEPLSCCLHGVDLCNIRCGGTVAVIGCGMIGLLMVKLAKLQGAAKIIAIEPSEIKRATAASVGADTLIDPINDDVDCVLKAQGIGRIETVIECAGRTNTIEQAIHIAGKQAVVMMYGLTAPDAKIKIKPFEFFKKELTIKSSFINPFTFERALNLISEGKIDVSSMIYKEETIERLPEILANPSERRGGKVVITFEG